MKKIVRNLIPKNVYQIMHKIKLKVLNIIEYPIIYFRYFHYKKVLKIKKEKVKNDKLNVIFLPIYSSIWKYDGLYKYFSNDERFNITIIVIPSEDNNVSEVELEKTYNYFYNKGYKVYKYNETINGTNIDINKHFEPDIIFYTRPYKNPNKNLFKYYNPIHFKNSLLCYVQYGYEQSSISWKLYNLFITNMMWKFFHETEYHLDDYSKNSRIKGKNGIVTGYPGCDEIIFDNQEYGKKPTIIWAPHHSISTDEWLNQSTFLDYYDYFIFLTKKYQDKINFVFKPHPMLKTKLEKMESWGTKKTEKYYHYWKNGKNTSLNETSYIELFNKSNALMIKSI